MFRFHLFVSCGPLVLTADRHSLPRSVQPSPTTSVDCKITLNLAGKNNNNNNNNNNKENNTLTCNVHVWLKNSPSLKLSQLAVARVCLPRKQVPGIALSLAFAQLISLSLLRKRYFGHPSGNFNQVVLPCGRLYTARLHDNRGKWMTTNSHIFFHNSLVWAWERNDILALMNNHMRSITRPLRNGRWRIQHDRPTNLVL